MLPKYHIIFGIIFIIVLSFLYSITLFQVFLILSASILIDFDHYMWTVKRKGYSNFKKIYLWNKNLPEQHKPMMHIFHTIEFHIFTATFIFFWGGFLFILIGMIFHSIIDFFTINLKNREYSLIRYLLSDKNKYL